MSSVGPVAKILLIMSEIGGRRRRRLRVSEGHFEKAPDFAVRFVVGDYHPSPGYQNDVVMGLGWVWVSAFRDWSVTFQKFFVVAVDCGVVLAGFGIF